MNKKLYDLLSVLGGEFRKKAALQLPEPMRSQEFIKILEKDISNGNLEYAQETVKFFERKLTVCELTKLLIKQEEDEYYHDAIETSRLLPEPQMIEELREILELCMRKGDIENFLIAKELLGRLVRVDELEILLKNQEAKKWFSNMLKTMYFFPEPLRTEKLKKYFDKQVASGNFHEAKHVAKSLNLELTTEQLEQFLKKYIEEGNFSCVKEVKKDLNRKLTVEELERLLEKLIELKSDYQAYEVVELIGRKLTLDELKKVHKDRLFKSCLWGIEKVEELLGRKLTTEELTTILESQIKDRDYGDAMDIAKHILGITK
jgi:hypothetical protein